MKITFNKSGRIQILLIILFFTSSFQTAYADAGSGSTYTDPSTGVTHYYNNKGELVGSSFVGEHGLEVHAKEGENIYIKDQTTPIEDSNSKPDKVIPRTEYEAKNKKFSTPEYVNTPMGRYKIRSVQYNSDGTLKSIVPAEKITLNIAQGSVSAFGTITFGLNNRPLIVELPDTLIWDKEPATVKIKTKIFFWENGIIKSFSTYYPNIEIITPIGKYSTDSSIDFYNDGMFKRFAFNGWERIKTPAGRYMIGAVGFDNQGVPVFYQFSENEPFTINGVSYNRNVTLKISPDGKVLGRYIWDSKTREWKAK